MSNYLARLAGWPIFILLPAAMIAQSPLVQDSYVATGGASVGANYGSSSSLVVGGANNSNVLVQFDLSLLPPGTTPGNVASATLTLFANRVSAPGTLNVSRAAGIWTESGVTGSNSPQVGGNTVTVGIPGPGGYLSIDITAIVKIWLAAEIPNNGLIITRGASGNVDAAFDSKENTTTSHPATLTITLGSAGPSGPTGPAGVNGIKGSDGTNGLPGPTGPTGAGSQGPAGPTGPIGAIGAAGPSTVSYISNGSTANLLQKLTSVSGASEAIDATAGDLTGLIGIASGTAAADSPVLVNTYGIASCIFDGGTTAGDYVQASPFANGQCHDAGATFPTSNQVIGIVLSDGLGPVAPSPAGGLAARNLRSNGNPKAGQTVSIFLFGMEIRGTSADGGPTGPEGPIGPTGVGLQGPNGPTGIGTQGPTGPTGVGLQGPNGPTGVGTQGPSGPIGATGPSTVSYISNGSTANLLQKFASASGTSQAVDATSDDLTGLIGIASGTAAAGSPVLVSAYGIVPCSFDGDTIAGDYVQASSFIGGACHDAGTSFPTSNQVLGIVLSSVSGNNNLTGGLAARNVRRLNNNPPPAPTLPVNVFLFGMEIRGTSSAAGPSGAGGATGPAGPTGPTGVGTQGANGPTGVGAQGPSGPIGPIGATGPSTVSYLSNGSTVNLLQKFTSVSGTSEAVDATYNDLTGLIGVASSTAAAGSTVLVNSYGIAPCTFDGSTTAGDYVQASQFSSGECHDAGATFPSNNQVLGFVLSSNSGQPGVPSSVRDQARTIRTAKADPGPTANVFLFGMEIRGFGSAAGPSGAAGATGPEGPSGPAGVGIQGPSGPTGVGSQGPSGATGPSSVGYTSNGSSSNLLQKLTTVGTQSEAMDATTSDLTGLVGIAASSVAAGSPVLVNAYGIASCKFDDSSTVAGHYMQASGLQPGRCHDAGASYPASNQVLGIVLTTTGGATFANVYLFGGVDVRGITATPGPTGPTGPPGIGGNSGAQGPSGPSGPAGGAGTGAIPVGIPYSVSGHDPGSVWHNPANSVSAAALSVNTTTIAPNACKPSMTLYSYSGVATTWTVWSVTPSTSSSTWVASTSIASCGTLATAGSSCSQTAASNVTAGTILTLSSGISSSGAAPGGGGFQVAFSCQ